MHAHIQLTGIKELLSRLYGESNVLFVVRILIGPTRPSLNLEAISDFAIANVALGNAAIVVLFLIERLLLLPFLTSIEGFVSKGNVDTGTNDVCKRSSCLTMVVRSTG